MKKIILLIMLCFQFIGMAQNSINYKAIIKDGSGTIVANQTITVQLVVLEGVAQTNIYEESHTPTTDINGLIVINIGEGGFIFGDYTLINWQNGAHYLNVFIDIGSGFVDMGISEFKTVPYAIQAENAINADNATNAINAINVVNVPVHNHLGEIWLGTESLTINTNASSIGALNISNSSAGGDGMRITSAGVDGLYVASAGDDGVHVASAGDTGGVFIGTNSGVHAESSINSNPDLILGGTASTATGDDGIIASDPSFSSSDIFLKSNDAVVIRLDDDANEEGNFQIKNGDNTNIFDINEYGETNITGTYNLFGSTFIVPIFELLPFGDLTIAGSLTQNSDRRLKKDIEDLQYGLTEILQLQPKAYNWKNRENTNKSLGLIAQDVQLIIEEVVTAKDDEQKTLGISYIELIPVLINAIKEQQKIIENQDDKYSILSKENNLIKQRLNKIEALLINKNENIEMVNNNKK